MTLIKQTKLFFDKDKVSQKSNQEVILSGNTIIASGGSLSILDNFETDRIIISDNQGKLSWGNNLSDFVTGATNGLYLDNNRRIGLGGEMNSGDTIISGNTGTSLQITDIGEFGLASGAIGFIGKYNNDITSIRFPIGVKSGGGDGIEINSSSNNFSGLFYADDYHSNFKGESLPDVDYVTGLTSNLQNQINNISGGTIINNAITGATNLGTGQQIYNNITDRKLELRSIIGSGDTTVTTSGNTLIINTNNNAIRKEITQTTHGFSVGDVVGYSGGSFDKPIADGLYDGEILGIVSDVIDANNFQFIYNGYITGLTGLVQSTTYYLSPTTAGGLTTTEPTDDGLLSKAMLIADSTTSGWVLPYVGYVITTGDTVGVSIIENVGEGVGIFDSKVDETLNLRSIIGSGDTTVSLSGQTIVVNTNAAVSFTGLTDTPNNYINNNYIKSTSNGIVYRTPTEVLDDIGADNYQNWVLKSGSTDTGHQINSNDDAIFSGGTDISLERINNCIIVNHEGNDWTDKVNLSGSEVIDNLTVNSQGHISDWSTRNLTASDIGAEPTITKHDLVGGTGISVTGGVTNSIIGSGNVTISLDATYLQSVDLGVNTSGTNNTITNSAGNNATLNGATTSSAGLVTNSTQTWCGNKTLNNSTLNVNRNDSTVALCVSGTTCFDIGPSSTGDAFKVSDIDFGNTVINYNKTNEYLMLMVNRGCVSIGTNAPSEKLDVNGKIRTESTKITDGTNNKYEMIYNSSTESLDFNFIG